MDKSEVVIFELDPKNEWAVADSYRWIWPPTPTLTASKLAPRLTNVFYRGGCGLVVSSFQGYIEIYDTIHISHAVWNNLLSP